VIETKKTCANSSDTQINVNLCFAAAAAAAMQNWKSLPS